VEVFPEILKNKTLGCRKGLMRMETVFAGVWNESKVRTVLVRRLVIVLLASGILLLSLPVWAAGQQAGRAEPTTPQPTKAEASGTSEKKTKAATPAGGTYSTLAKTRSKWTAASTSALVACKQFDTTRKRLKQKMLNQATRDNPPDVDSATEALQNEWEKLKVEEKIQTAMDLARELIEQGEPPVPLTKKLDEIKWKCEGKPILRVDGRGYPLR